MSTLPTEHLAIQCSMYSAVQLDMSTTDLIYSCKCLTYNYKCLKYNCKCVRDINKQTDRETDRQRTKGEGVKEREISLQQHKSLSDIWRYNVTCTQQ